MVIGLALAAAAAAALPTDGLCRELLAAPSQSVPTRPIEADDLLRLVDIGSNGELLDAPSPLGVSPDGTLMALQLRRADPATNRYCLAVIAVPLDGGGRPMLLDVSEDLVREPNVNRGLDLGLSGVSTIITPRWSPDGKLVAFLVGDQGRVKVRIVGIDGVVRRTVNLGGRRPFDLRWTPSGENLVAVVGGDVGAQDASIEQEGRSGFVFDDRFWPVDRARPAAVGTSAAPGHVAIDLQTGAIRLARSDEVALFTVASSAPSGAQIPAAHDRGALAWREAVDGRVLAPTRIRLRRNGSDVPCQVAACGDGAAGLWWDGNNLVILRHDYPARRGRMELHRWHEGAPAPRKIMETPALLTGCVRTRRELLCVRETGTRPRHIVRLDLRSGAMDETFDPNPRFRALTLGEVRPMTWTDRFGASVFGSLVLPIGYRAGTAYPLIVTTYQARGFLRGGTGDEYPVQLFARAGYAVLAWQQTRVPNDDPNATTLTQYQHAVAPGALMRRRLFAQVEEGIDKAIALGIADPSRIGITGLSDGAAGACYALINSSRFTAASISSGCEDPQASFAHVGPRYRNDLLAWRYPWPEMRPDDYWHYTSLARNAPRITAPILIQSADSEYRFALETVDAFQRHGKPIEMYVFPGEEHIKWQPAHRAAVYRRNVEWFDFWLRGTEHEAGDSVEQYRRWRTLRALKVQPSAGTLNR